MPRKNKKIIIISIAAVVAVAVTAAVILLMPKKIKASEPISISGVTDKSDITLTAHRGFSCNAPENTVPAILAAGEKGYKYAEFDVRLTEDMVWVVSHDKKIDRMTNGKGKMSDYTYFELSKYKIDNGANIKNYENLKIPTLDAALEACLESGLVPMIEIKDYNTDALQSLNSSIKKYGYEKNCCIISFNYDILNDFAKINPDAKLLFLVSKLDKEHMELCLSDKNVGVSFKADKKKNNPEKIKELQENGNDLFCWTVNDEDTLAFYAENGVKNFVTDRIVP